MHPDEDPAEQKAQEKKQNQLSCHGRGRKEPGHVFLSSPEPAFMRKPGHEQKHLHGGTGICPGPCPSPWCCSSRRFMPPPLSQKDMEKISSYTGEKHFFEIQEGIPALRVKPDNNCIFLDNRTNTCTIYPARPVDCRIFPFDFFPCSKDRAVWLLWECRYFSRPCQKNIEAALVFFETHYKDFILETWDYGNRDYRLEEEGVFLKPMGNPGCATNNISEVNNPVQDCFINRPTTAGKKSPYRFLRRMRIASFG